MMWGSLTLNHPMNGLKYLPVIQVYGIPNFINPQLALVWGIGFTMLYHIIPTARYD